MTETGRALQADDLTGFDDIGVERQAAGERLGQRPCHNSLKFEVWKVLSASGTDV